MFCRGKIDSLMNASFVSNITITMRTTPTEVIFLVHEHFVLMIRQKKLYEIAYKIDSYIQ